MADKDIKHESRITLTVGMDENRVPVEIEWDSTDSSNADTPAKSKALLLSLFDEEHKDTYKIDLWTSEMQIVEMDRFMFQTLRGLADTYFKATNNKELAEQMQRFVQYFGEQTEIIPSSED